ncbi:MAG: TetR/AcrR family transcriptional regulator [Verrucomicrobiota bacterium]
MNVHSFYRSMAQLTTDNTADRRSQILSAAMVCFAKRGFHQTSMHDISAEAGISVGLIYRYFESKNAVISAMADGHKREIHTLLESARQAPTLLDALEIFFTAHCCAGERQLQSAFVVNLYAEGSRNPLIAQLVRDVLNTSATGVAELIAQSPEMRDAPAGMKPQQIAQLIFDTARGALMRDAIENINITPAERRKRQLAVMRNLWRLLFTHANEPAFA